MNLNQRLAAVEALLGLRKTEPELENLRFEQAALAGKLLNLAASTFRFSEFQDDLLASYARARLAQMGVTKQTSEPFDCDQDPEKSS
jgi:hypothetical protein